MLKQNLQQRLIQKLSPQQIQLMKLLQVPTVSLEQRIKEELELNPALEEGAEEEEPNEFGDENEFEAEANDEKTSDDSREDFDFDQYFDDDETPGYKLSIKNSGPDEERKEIPFAGGNSFHDFILAQLGLRVLDEKQFAIAENIIGNIDDDGYLRRETSSLVNDLAFSQNIYTSEEEIISLLKIVQEFDPAGVGARTLQECLELQLRRKNLRNPYVTLALEIIVDHFDEFSKKHYEKISRKLNINDETLKLTINEILRLNPKPGNSTSSQSSKYSLQIIPDFVINNSDGELELSLNSRNAPELKISRSYMEMLQNYSIHKDRESKEAAMFVKDKLDSAKWFIDAIKQRQQTLMLTMQAIMEYQYDYFLEGDETKMKPMILKDIAEKIGLDISTVSRVANSKYVQTEFGTHSLKYFFSESLSTDSGEEVSTREVKKILQDCIEAEQKRKPLTDDKLAEILRDKGYNIARRTIAKYREQLNIPVARMRKEL